MFSPSQVELLKLSLTSTLAQNPGLLQSRFGENYADQVVNLMEYIDVLVAPIENDDTTMTLANLIAEMDEILERYKD